MGETFVQKAADGLIYKMWHHCTQSVQSHKSRKVREASVMSSSTRPSKTYFKFGRKFLMMFLQLRDVFVTKE